MDGDDNMIIMLILGIALALVGFIAIYKGTFACSLELVNSIVYLIPYIFFMTSFDKLEPKIFSLTALLLIGLFLNNGLKSMFTASKETYLVFNIKTYDLLNVLSSILEEQSINFQVIDHSILLNLPDETIIRVKPTLFDLNTLNLSAITGTDLYNVLNNKLELALSQTHHRKPPLFGALLFCSGLITIILFYAVII